MKMTFSVSKEEGFIIVSMTGKHHVEDFVQFYHELFATSKSGAIDAVIWDARNLNVGHVTEAEIRNIIRGLQKKSDPQKGGKAAWVVDNKLGFGLARMFQLISSDKLPIDIKVFYDLAEAKEWVCKDRVTL